MFSRRVHILGILFAIGFVMLMGQLAYLQGVRGEALRKRGRDRLHRLEQIPPRRGGIYDQRGQPLALDRPTWDLYLTPGRWRRTAGGGRVPDLIFDTVPAARVRDILRAHGARRAEERELALSRLLESEPLIDQLAGVLAHSNVASSTQQQPLTERVAGAILDALMEAVDDPAHWSLFDPRRLFRDIGDPAYLAILADQRRAGEESPFAPIVLKGSWERDYPLGEAAAHITGYVGPLSARHYQRLRGRWGPDGIIPGEGAIPGFFEPTPVESYIMRLYEITRHGESVRVAGHLENDTVGRSGLERQYNQVLRGSHGLRHLRLTRPEPGAPRVMRVVGTEDSGQPGRDLYLTVDGDFQKTAHRILREAVGELEAERDRSFTAAAVLMDPTNGAIRALVSLPSFDPSPAVLARSFRRLSRPESNKPFLNRVSRGIYPPGSTFKPVVALAALSAGAIGPETELTCDGVIRRGGHDFICMRRYAHGPLTVEDALRVSCNVFFYQAGARLGSRDLYAFARDLGFDERTGIDLPNERGGIIPEAAGTGVGWSLGATYHFSIGQRIAITPLQLAVAVSAIANGGTVVQPHLLSAIDNPTPEQARRLARLRRPQRTVDLPPEALETVRRGMWKVVNGRGTGRRCRLDAIEVCGKSGSADWKRGEPTHAWFTAYAPADQPQIVAAVVVPEGDLGGATCAPIVRRLLEAFFEIPATRGAVGAAPAAEEDACG